MAKRQAHMKDILKDKDSARKVGEFNAEGAQTMFCCVVVDSSSF
jgi:hypothetical protein